MNLSGAGLGFRREIIEQLDHILKSEKPFPIDFFEIAPENWMAAGGRYQYDLQRYTEQFPFACHGLSLSIGSADPLDTNFIRKIKVFLDSHNIDLYTEHLSWCSYNGHLYDLLPIPFNEESAQWVINRVKQVQDILERPIALENASYYVRPPSSTMDEVDFISEIVKESNCHLHLDVNNIYVNSRNFQFDPYDYLLKLPLSRVNYIHVAGHYTEEDGIIVDTHGNSVIETVWQLLKRSLAAIPGNSGSIPVCLERDFNFPEIQELVDEVKIIRNIQSRFRPNIKSA